MPSASVIFLGVFLTGFGSSYYHWQPDDAGLFWDRLPMAVGFMAILSYVIEERIDAKVGAALLWPLVALGVVSLLLWRWTDDLRLYGWVQFFPCVVLPLVFWLFPSRQYSGDRLLVRRGGSLCPRQAARIRRRHGVLGAACHERARAQASGRRCRLLCDPARGRSSSRYLSIT